MLPNVKGCAQSCTNQNASVAPSILLPATPFLEVDAILCDVQVSRVRDPRAEESEGVARAPKKCDVGDTFGANERKRSEAIAIARDPP